MDFDIKLGEDEIKQAIAISNFKVAIKLLYFYDNRR